MLGSHFWGARKSYPASPWRNWTGAANGALTTVSSDVYGGPNNNQFNCCMTSPNQGIATWAPASGNFEFSGGRNVNSKCYRAFYLNGAAISFGASPTVYNQTNLNANVTIPCITAVSATQAVASMSVYSSFANYSTQFQLVSVDGYTQVVTIQFTTDLGSEYGRVTDQCLIGGNIVIAAMENVPSNGGAAFVWVSWTGVQIIARGLTGASGFRASRLYPINASTFAATGVQVGPNTTHLKIYNFSFSTNTLTEIATYPLNRPNQRVLFQSPTRFITSWGSGPYSVAELTFSPSFQIYESAPLTTTMAVDLWSMGAAGFTLDGATAIIQQQSSAGNIQMRVIDIGSEVNVGAWLNVTPSPGYFSTTDGAVFADSTKFIFHFTDTAFTTGNASGKLMVVSR